MNLINRFKCPGINSAKCVITPQNTAVQELRAVQGILERGGHWILDERRLQSRPFLSPVHGVGRDHIDVSFAVKSTTFCDICAISEL